MDHADLEEARNKFLPEAPKEIALTPWLQPCMTYFVFLSLELEERKCLLFWPSVFVVVFSCFLFFFFTMAIKHWYMCVLPVESYRACLIIHMGPHDGARPTKSSSKEPWYPGTYWRVSHTGMAVHAWDFQSPASPKVKPIAHNLRPQTQNSLLA